MSIWRLGVKMTDFKIGDDVYIKGVIVDIDSRKDKFPYSVVMKYGTCQSGDYEWVSKEGLILSTPATIKKRKPIAISSFVDEDRPYDNEFDYITTVICDDGTIWRNDGGDWIKLKEIPQD